MSVDHPTIVRRCSHFAEVNQYWPHKLECNNESSKPHICTLNPNQTLQVTLK